ncbi:MAG: substrate-binding domain-containing protein [Chloroflexi bacterium]|nr:MAG: substrate-binding domain-containing protein [Chloroflexota bacterium]TMC40863.1 MAG: substrate-binding domain-containing protein [Chloroflexota bacterium]TME62695.1 MAG: substrate-binding domain-containing protein [Chloroflexota bacterium]
MEDTELGNKSLSRREFLAGTAAVLAGGSLLAACGGSTSTPGSSSTNYTFVLIQGVKGDPFYVTMQKGAQAMADKLGVKLLVDGPAQFSATLQSPIVDAYIAKKVDVMIIAACDKQAMIAPLQRANDAGIKVISVDTFIGNGDYTSGPVTFPLSYIGSDNVQGGMIAGQALIKSIGNKGGIYIENVTPGISTTDQRQQGCEQAIKATNGAVTLVGSNYDNDSAATASQQVSALLSSSKGTKVNGIFGTNLFSAEGSAQAVKNANKQGQIKIANFDAPQQAIVDLNNGVVDLVIAQKPSDMGSTAVQYGVYALTGKTSSIHKRVATGYVVIDKTNVNDPASQAAIYKSS